MNQPSTAIAYPLSEGQFKSLSAHMLTGKRLCLVRQQDGSVGVLVEYDWINMYGEYTQWTTTPKVEYYEIIPSLNTES